MYPVLSPRQRLLRPSRPTGRICNCRSSRAECRRSRRRRLARRTGRPGDPGPHAHSGVSTPRTLPGPGHCRRVPGSPAQAVAPGAGCRVGPGPGRRRPGGAARRRSQPWLPAGHVGRPAARAGRLRAVRARPNDRRPGHLSFADYTALPGAPSCASIGWANYAAMFATQAPGFGPGLAVEARLGTLRNPGKHPRPTVGAGWPGCAGTGRQRSGRAKMLMFLPVRTQRHRGRPALDPHLRPAAGASTKAFLGLFRGSTAHFYGADNWAMVLVIFVQIWQNAGFSTLVFIGGCAPSTRRICRAASMRAPAPGPGCAASRFPLLAPAVTAERAAGHHQHVHHLQPDLRAHRWVPGRARSASACWRSTRAFDCSSRSQPRLRRGGQRGAVQDHDGLEMVGRCRAPDGVLPAAREARGRLYEDETQLLRQPGSFREKRGGAIRQSPEKTDQQRRQVGCSS